MPYNYHSKVSCIMKNKCTKCAEPSFSILHSQFFHSSSIWPTPPAFTGCPDCIWWLTGFPNIPSRSARSRFSPCRPRSGISCAECRHGFSLPSAVTRMRSQSAQKRWLIGRIRPIFLPAGHSAPAKRLHSADAAALAGVQCTASAERNHHAASPPTRSASEFNKAHLKFSRPAPAAPVPESRPCLRRRAARHSALYRGIRRSTPRPDRPAYPRASRRVSATQIYPHLRYPD